MLRKTELELRKIRTLALLKKGESHEMIAEKLGMTPEAFRAYLFRLRKKGYSV
jgi:biotin operon repressor